MQFLRGFAAQYLEHLLWSIVRDHLKLQVRLSSYFSLNFNRYRRKRPKVDASIFDSALSHTRRSDASEKRDTRPYRWKFLFLEHKDLERQEFFAKKTWTCNILAYILGLAGIIIMIVMLVQMSSTTVYYCTSYTGFC